MAAVKKGWAATMKEYFGSRPGKSVADFMVELKTLNNEERQEFHRMLVAAGYDCEPPAEIKR